MDNKNELQKTLSDLKPITLNEMDSVRLMNRVDYKFVFHCDIIPEILKKASADYQILEINNTRDFSYTTTYFDTESHEMYSQHLQGKLNRFKIRVRLYELTGNSFLEIKYHTNKGRTLKDRIEVKETDCITCDSYNFVKSRLPFPADKLVPALYNKFNRITLVSMLYKERITIDYNIRFEDLKGNKKGIPHIGIVEIKKDGNSHQSKFIDLLREHRIHNRGFSKYCVGSALLFDNFKNNALKPKLMFIEKIKQENKLFLNT